MGSAAGWTPVEDTAAWTPVHEEKPGAMERFLDPLNPMHLVHALYKPASDPNEDSMVTFGKNVMGLVRDTGMAQVEQGKAALESWKKGNHADAVAQGMAALTPILGPMSQQAAEKFNSGDVAGGMGTLTAIALPEILHEAPGAVRATADAARRGVKAITQPGIAQMVGGAGEAAAGTAMTMTHPIAGPGLVVGGAARIKKGLEAFQAGKAARLAEEAAERGRQLAAEHRAGPQRVPAWAAGGAEAPVMDPLTVETDPAAALPSGRQPGGIQNQQVPAPVQVAPRRIPAWANGGPEAPIMEPVVVENDPAAALPSGRRPGGIHNMQTPGQPTLQMLQQAGVPFTAEEQALADHILRGTEPQPPAAGYEDIPLQGPAEGNVIPIQPQGEPIQPEITLPEVNPEVVAPEVVTPSEAPSAPKKPSPSAANAKALSNKLMDWDFTPKEAQGMNEVGWVKLAGDAGLAGKIPTAAMRKNAIFNLIKQRAGPAMTLDQLIQRFRTIGEDMQGTGK